MAGVGKLPDDILHEVLLLFCSLKDLRAAILSSRLFFEPFARRRQLIIGRVFCRQVTSANLNSQAAIEQAASVVKRLSKCNQADAVIVYEALSPLLSNDSPREPFFQWALSLYRWCQRVEDGAGDRPVVLLERVHQSLLSIPPIFNPAASNTAQERPTKKGGRWRTHHLGQTAQNLCRHLVKEYTTRNRLADALAVQKSIHQRLMLKNPDSGRWGAEVVAGFRAQGQFNEAVEYEMGVYQISKAATDPTTVRLEWARHLIMEYTLAGHTQDALRFQAEVLAADLRPGTGEHAAWARQLIRMQKRAGLTQAALNTKSNVWQRMSWSDPCYFGWARELADDFRQTRQPDEAVRVIESLHRETKRQLARRPNDGWIRYHSDHATRALVGAYRSCGRLQSATEIESVAS